MIDETIEIRNKHQTVQSVASLSLAMATKYARVGQLSDAENVLRDLINAGIKSSDIFDLLARVLAQMGHYERAAEMWQKAISVDPTNVSYKKALDRISRIRDKKLTRGKLLSLALILILAGGAFYFYHYRHNTRKDTVQVVAQVPTQIVKETTVSKISGPESIMIDAPHLVKNVINNNLVLTFDEGVFVSGTKFKHDIGPILLQLAQQLQNYSKTTYCLVEGITDDLPVRGRWEYRDNYSLGISRAVTTVEYLRSVAAFPDDYFTFRTGNIGKAPYPNDSIENRLKNRTVIFTVSTKKETD